MKAFLLFTIIQGYYGLKNLTDSQRQNVKKGVCIAPEYFQCDDVSALPGVSWYYNWGTHPNNLDHAECNGKPIPPGRKQ